MISEKQIINNSQLALRIRGIYFLIQNQKIVYIGQSHDVINRIYTHLNKGKKGFDSFSYIEIAYDKLNILEAEYIVKFKPIHNTKLPSNDKYKSAEILLKLLGWNRWKLKKVIKNNRILPVYEGFCKYYHVDDFAKVGG
jgi:predicted GIY-YIG superfamily endonuclease